MAGIGKLPLQSNTKRGKKKVEQTKKSAVLLRTMK